jgi:transposase
MAIVAGFDVHRAQITFDALDDATGEVSRGRIAADRDAVRRWVERFDAGEIHVAVEACTGWLFVCEALREAGAIAHLAEPCETSALRGNKRRAKTDRADARWLRELLAEGRLPEAWIPPEHVREWRTRARLRKTLVDERTTWLQRVQATLFHHGIGGVPDHLLTAAGREFLDRLELPAADRQRIDVALAMVDALDHQLAPVERELRALARRQAGCRALMGHFGIGELTAPTILCEPVAATRLSASRKAVRCAGLDIGVHRSDRRSRAGKLTRQGSPQLRWALYEAAQSACRPASPDHADYLALKARGLSHTRASMTIARKLARRCFHTLRELDGGHGNLPAGGRRNSPLTAAGSPHGRPCFSPRFLVLSGWLGPL